MHEAFVFAIIKVIAVAITFAGRMGGGVFSPSLMLGALTGLTFGLLATSVYPGITGSQTIYAWPVWPLWQQLCWVHRFPQR